MFVRRLDFHASWGMLLAFDLVEGDQPAEPTGKRVATDDSPGEGPSFWRADIHERNLSGLSMPGWHIGRCRVDATPFQDTNLQGAALRGSEFGDCDFRRANLRDADLTGSDFDRCLFDDADLSGADLSGACFLAGCSFAGARLSGARVNKSQAGDLSLSPQQASEVTWIEG